MLQIDDLSEVESFKAGGALPNGSYQCQIDSATEGRSSGGHPQVELLLRVLDGEYAGQTTRDWLVITAASLGGFKAVMEAAGLDVPAGAFAFDPSEFVGQRVGILVRGEEYGGKTRQKVQGYSFPSEPNGAAPTSNGKAGDDVPF